MPPKHNLLSRPIGRDESLALAGFLFCILCSVALIPISFWGMIQLEFTPVEMFLGSLLTISLSILLVLGGALPYLFVKFRPEPVKVPVVGNTPNRSDS